MTKIKKSDGVSKTEHFLAELCDRTFLKLWSYPNPYKDDSHELCDLLAVFENHVFIFFDRENRQLGDADKDPHVQWLRWKKKAVDAQIKTAHGAARYIRSGRDIFLDAKLETPFPVSLDREHLQIHLIVVAHGASEACAAASEENVYGSLAIAYGDGAHEVPFPFFLDLDRKAPVHVFDSHNLPIVLRELDTVTDFSAYLAAKEAAIARYDFLSYCGEEDLLAHYLYNFDEGTQTRKIGLEDDSCTALMIGEGEWKDFIQLPQYLEKKRADKISYRWDALLQLTAQNALDGRLVGEGTAAIGKSAITEMAKESRFFRRILSEKITESISTFPDNPGPLSRKVTLLPSSIDGTAYVFLQLHVEEKGDYDTEYRPARAKMLEIACGAAKNKFSHLTRIVGIAVDAAKHSKSNSEDFILMDCADWSSDNAKVYQEANRDFKFFESEGLRPQRLNAFEYPLPQATGKPVRRRREKTGRNAPCPCGSGIKYKKCCLKH